MKFDDQYGTNFIFVNPPGGVPRTTQVLPLVGSKIFGDIMPIGGRLINIWQEVKLNH